MATGGRRTLWIDLRDPVGARLRALVHQNRRHLVLEGVPPQSRAFRRAIDDLGFTSSKSGAYLVKPFNPGDALDPRAFRTIWPGAIAREMPLSAFMIALRPRVDAPEPEAAPDAQQERDLHEIRQLLSESAYLGRNSAGLRVFEGRTGRFAANEADALIYESDAAGAGPMFLRANTEAELVDCAHGFIRGIELGEVQRDGDFERFVSAVLGGEIAGPGADDGALLGLAAGAIDEAKVAYLVARHGSPVEAWGDAIRLTEYMATDWTTSRAQGAPLPLALAAGHVLGLYQDESTRVAVPRRLLVDGLQNGVAIAFTPDDVELLAIERQDDRLLPALRDKAGVAAPEEQGFGFAIAQVAWSLDPEALTAEFRRVIRGMDRLAPGGCGAVLLPLEDALRPGIVSAGHREVLDALQSTSDIEVILDIPAALTRSSGIADGARMVVLSRRISGAPPAGRFALKACHSWDEVKTVLDEVLLARGQRPSGDERVRVDGRALENDLQRPYTAFSRIGTATTMVPKNLQAPLNYALAQVEEQHGPIDEFVAYELGMGLETLGDRFSPEQIDAIGLCIARVQKGRAPIIGDDTGIGKGRELAGLAVWASKQDRPVIVITDRANLFSDFARDLIDIGEFARFQPMAMNADGHILDIMGGNELLVEATSPSRMEQILDAGSSLADLNSNLLLLTYSQINREDSKKGDWVLDQCKGALTILDEAHIAAGSDSKIADRIRQISEASWGVAYSSATWAKSAKNLHVYVRAFPESVNITQVTAAMKRGGEEFGEVFSAMLARDGGFIRREHDLSKLEVNVIVDDPHYGRNRQFLAQISEVLGMMSLMSGEIDSLLQRANSETRTALVRAKHAREEWIERAERELKSLESEIKRLSDAGENADAGAQSGELERRKVELATLTRELGTRRTGKFFESSFGTGGVVYQAMRRTMAALLADQAVDRAIAAIEAGRRPVIVFDDTGESFVRQFIEQEQERIAASIAARRADAETQAVAELLAEGRRRSTVDQIRMPMLKDLMRAFLRKLGGVRTFNADDTMRREDAADTDDDGEGDTVAVTISAIPGVTREQVDAYGRGVAAIAERIDALPDIPISPADVMRTRLEEAGIRTAEISGRTYELRKVAAEGGSDTDSAAARTPADWTGYWKLGKRAKRKVDVMGAVAKFNAGDIDAVLLNRSGATGMSMHASRRFINQDRREMIEYQIPEDPTARLQLYGRVNRFDQVVGPMISICTTGLRGELRSLMMQNRKLAGLSVNVRSSRENAALIDDIPDMLNSVGDEVCQDYLMENPGVMSRLCIDVRRVQESIGLANLVTQRIALLHPDDQDKVYDDLFAAYEDAVIRRELSGEGTVGARDKDWRAQTVDEARAWGPGGEMPAEMFSAFDGAVNLRTVEYVKDYRPITWEDLVEAVAASNAALVTSGRASVVPLEATTTRSRFFAPLVDLQGELRSSAADRLARQSQEVVSQLKDAASYVLANESGSAEETPIERRQRLSAWRDILAGTWVPVQIRRSGQDVYDRFVAFVPRRAPYVCVWQLNGDRSGLLRLRLDVQPPRLEVAGIQVPREGAAWVRAFKDAYLPQDARLRTVSLHELVQNGVQMWEGKKVIALSRTDFATAEDALASGDHNAVKEAHWRALFMKKVMGHLVPGVEVTLREIVGPGRNSFWSGGDRLLLIRVEPPGPSDEAVLSKWKYHFVRPGDETPTVLTAASLFKRAGDAPEFDLVDARGQQLFEYESTQERQRLERRFSQLEPGPVTMRRKLLTGNLFQAVEWAEATKAGRPITYTDETGQRHRAIEIREGQFGRNGLDVYRLPVRLHHREMIKKFVALLFEVSAANAAQGRPAVGGGRHDAFAVPLSFRAALHEGDRRNTQQDMVIFEPAVNDGNGAIAFGLDKQEKARFVRMIRGAVAQDKREWERSHDADSPYPITFATRSGRGPRDSSTALVGFALPEGLDARNRLIDLIVQSVGLQLYVRPMDTQLAQIARAAEAAFYEDVAARLSPARRELLAAQEERRARIRSLVGDGFDQLGGNSASAESVAGGNEATFEPAEEEGLERAAAGAHEESGALRRSETQA